MLKIDVHAHYLPRSWPDLAKKYGDARFPVAHVVADALRAVSLAQMLGDAPSPLPHSAPGGTKRIDARLARA